MTVMNLEDIQAFADAQPNEAYEVTQQPKGSVEIPITDGHVALAWQYFKNNWAPGVRFDFRKLSRLSKCVPGTARDFTADGVAEGQKLSPAQVKVLFNMWLSERAERLSS